MQKIGLFGGTFDPVHYGHLAVGKAALEQLDLDSLIFIPAPSPPHKQSDKITPFYHRLAMLELAIGEDHGFSVSPIEAELQGLSYTIDTLTILRRRFKGDVTFFYVIGLDAFAEISTWKQYQLLLSEVSFVVIDRPSHDNKTCEEIVCTELHGYSASGEGCWRNENGSTVYRLVMDPVAVSSTEIRELLRNGKAVEEMVPPAVIEYIQAKSLYARDIL
ncbi:MAG: nicotinate (nicotinamide) nucleotide adenylyltransferase [Desulfobulbaceae bacterium]|uniref:Probable nicotinate-nucleotide adenylyltransferase n=1 Tax=Candidatus Desulfobia pelagia TaxID=2841692 RepID=A0A8J6NAB4_9BACT|nr:nicotinate (nicotinamide) nucleotide adenylyltransferase [Candidatus Desulfobia pelagia]